MVTVYTVVAVKDVHTSDETVRRYISVDGGMSDNIRPALYSARSTTADWLTARRQHLGRHHVVGSHCESGDILVNDTLPDDIGPGDLLVIPGTGAYCYMMASRYNVMPRPAGGHGVQRGST